MKSLSGYLRTKMLRKRLEQPPVIYKQRVGNIEIDFSVHTWVEYHNRAILSYTAEPDMVSFIMDNLKEGDVFWDVGANVGAYSLLAAKIQSADVNVIAFEPYIPTFAHLWDNIVLNNCSNRITPICCALSDHTNIDFLGVSDPRAGSSEHVVGDATLKLTQPSLAIKGDDASRLFGLPQPTLLKIDVDGYEVNLLNGMTKILKKPSLRAVIIEAERGKTEEPVFALMTDSGFQRVSDSSFLNPDSPVFNTVYKRKL